jgi:hypothetical protein
VNAGWVKRYGKCGKCQLRRNERFPRAAWLGAAGSAHFFRAYPKPDIHAFRLEHQVNRGFLDRYGIETPADYARLPEIFNRQSGFFQVNWPAVNTYVRRHLRHPQALLSMARRRSDTLTGLLKFLRCISVTNPERFLRPLPINEVICDALRAWGEQWKSDGRNAKRIAKDRQNTRLPRKRVKRKVTVQTITKKRKFRK